MAQVKPDYEVIENFNTMANQIVEKYPDMFYGIDVDKLRCVKITNKERPHAEGKPNTPWSVVSVKMPMRLDCPYAWYITIHHNDWDEMDTSHKLLLVADILQDIPKDGEEGKVVPCDVKGHAAMFRTFKSIDYLTDADVPNILEEDIQWRVTK
jgi:hypothetical protein